MQRLMVVNSKGNSRLDSLFGNLKLGIIFSVSYVNSEKVPIAHNGKNSS